jgi:hypothetical protein
MANEEPCNRPTDDSAEYETERRYVHFESPILWEWWVTWQGVVTAHVPGLNANRLPVHSAASEEFFSRRTNYLMLQRVAEIFFLQQSRIPFPTAAERFADL